MPRKSPRFHSLKKLNIRQNWSRWTLYAISQLRPPPTGNKTYFQQKWAAKAATRAYHGEQVREKKWKRIFSRHLPAVVSMNYTYLAKYDGSEQAAGRGTGADSKDKVRKPPMTPYMQMTYHPLERRLDTAIFRALFASSVRQARQFVVHGLVKVNGKKMPFPGYRLNPGDMFQVEPSSVMFATGAPKTQGSASRRNAIEAAAARAEAREQNKSKPTTQVEEDEEEDDELPQTKGPEPTPEELKKYLQHLMKQADTVLFDTRSAKDKQNLRALKKSIRRAISLWKSANPETVSTLDTQFDFLKAQMVQRAHASSSPGTTAVTTASTTDSASPDGSNSIFSEEAQSRLEQAFKKLENDSQRSSVLSRKTAVAPWAIPWRPRDYMSAFAFIPRYLEVNQNICAAVYLRHPVARPGLAEVPTPFHIDSGQLAFNWYLRNR